MGARWANSSPVTWRVQGIGRTSRAHMRSCLFLSLLGTCSSICNSCWHASTGSTPAVQHLLQLRTNCILREMGSSQGLGLHTNLTDLHASNKGHHCTCISVSDQPSLATEVRHRGLSPALAAKAQRTEKTYGGCAAREAAFLRTCMPTLSSCNASS